MLRTDEISRANVAAGFNFPPSQYQLHLQYMLPVFTPFHFKLYTQGHHFTYNRFLPYEFVESALKYCVENKTSLPKGDEMSIEDIFSFFESKGVSYVSSSLLPRGTRRNTHVYTHTQVRQDLERLLQAIRRRSPPFFSMEYQ